MSTPKKIAILGGGMGSLSAAYWMTNTPDWQKKYDITVYQMGWRLGGKGASGRNPKVADRIEEHGFHVLFGFYENTFQTMRACYEELGRTPDQPFSEFIAPTPEDEEKYPDRYAMKRMDFIRFYDPRSNPDGAWEPLLNFYAYPNDRLPGDGQRPPTLGEVIHQIWAWIQEGHEFFGKEHDEPSKRPKWLQDLANIDLPDFGKVDDLAEGVLKGLAHVGEDLADLDNKIIAEVVEGIGKLIDKIPRANNTFEKKVERAVLNAIAYLLKLYLRLLWQHLKGDIDNNWDDYALWIRQDFLITNAIGMLEDNLIFEGFDKVNDQNYYEWFWKHGAVKDGTKLTVSSSFMGTLHDLCFAYLHGDTTAAPTPEKPLKGLPSIEAGTMLRGLTRLFLQYKGALGWWFQAGCGEILVAPVYLALKARGVKFEFFHKVHKLHIDPNDKTQIGSIDMERQATLSVDEYEPLYDVKGVPCWTVEAPYDQLVEGKTLEEKGINLESSFADWQGEMFTMERGKDFDQIILGISWGALPQICSELIEQSEKWSNLNTHLQTVRTGVFQIWMNKTSPELGWDMNYGRPVDGLPLCYVDFGIQPVNTYADFAEEIPKENWPADHMPKTIGYLGGAMKDDPEQPPFNAPNPDYPPTQVKLVRDEAVAFFTEQARHIWPKSGVPFDWNLFVDLNDGEGEARLDAQYIRANIDPTERYVISVPGSGKYRLKAGETDFENLVVAGDWLNTGLNAGCMESTVMSGMQASRAVTGSPQRIPGETDFEEVNEA